MPWQRHTNYDIKAIYAKACRYCAYQERTKAEVRQWLKKNYTLNHTHIEQLIQKLTAENYLNEARFARLYAQSKLRQKYWGKHKIAYHLQQKGISGQTLQEALDSIDADEYMQILSHLLQKKYTEIQNSKYSLDVVRARLLRFMQGKGFEYELIVSVLEQYQEK